MPDTTDLDPVEAATRLILRSLGGADRATVVAVVDDAAHAIPLPSAATVDIRWLVRDPGQPDPLLAELRDRGGLVGPGTYVWGGGESREITAVRHHVRHDLGLTQAQVSLTGYWRTTQGDDR